MPSIRVASIEQPTTQLLYSSDWRTRPDAAHKTLPHHSSPPDIVEGAKHGFACDLMSGVGTARGRAGRILMEGMAAALRLRERTRTRSEGAAGLQVFLGI